MRIRWWFVVAPVLALVAACGADVGSKSSSGSPETSAPTAVEAGGVSR